MSRATRLLAFVLVVAFLVTSTPDADARHGPAHVRWLVTFEYDMTVHGDWSDERSQDGYEYNAADVFDARYNWSGSVVVVDGETTQLSSGIQEAVSFNYSTSWSEAWYNFTHVLVKTQWTKADCHTSKEENSAGTAFLTGTAEAKDGAATFIINAGGLAFTADLGRSCPSTRYSWDRDVSPHPPLYSNDSINGGAAAPTNAALGPTFDPADPVRVHKLNFRTALGGAETFHHGSSGVIPGAEFDSSQLYCGMIVASTDFAKRPGKCTWEGTLKVKGIPDPCEGRQEEFDAEYAQLKSFGAPPAGARVDGYQLSSYQDVMGYFASRVRAYARAEALYSCDTDLRDSEKYVDDLLSQLRDSWERLFTARPDDHYLSDYLAIERQAQLSGLGEGTNAPPITIARDAAGTLGITLHSPVSVHAYTRDGLHVGWNATTNTSEATVPGSSYQGRPGGYQRIQLPAGEYRIVIDELGDGKFILDSEWSAPGLEGNETFLAESRAGRTTSTYYVVEEDASGAWNVTTAPVLRQTTGSAVQGFARSPATEVRFPDESDATGLPPGYPTFPTGFPTTLPKGFPTTFPTGFPTTFPTQLDSAAPPPEAKPTPAWGALLAVGGLAGAALARRR